MNLHGAGTLMAAQMDCEKCLGSFLVFCFASMLQIRLADNIPKKSEVFYDYTQLR